MKSQLQPPADPKRDTLFGALLETVDRLKRCRAGEIPEGYIDGYVALDWLEWDRGALRLTSAGSKVCAQITRDLAWRLPE